jgi:hypothetical protein
MGTFSSSLMVPLVTLTLLQCLQVVWSNLVAMGPTRTKIGRLVQVDGTPNRSPGTDLDD